MEKPDAELLEEIRRETEANHHLRANSLVAGWCAENYTGDDRTRKARFLYFKDYFDRLLAHVEDVCIVPFWEISFLMGKELDKEIVRSFGTDVLIVFNSAR